MRHTHSLGRLGILVLIIVGLAAATAAATRWTPWSPLSSCLFCGTQDPVRGTAAAKHDEPIVDRVASQATARSHVDALATGALEPLVASARGVANAERHDRDDDLSRQDWQPWGGTTTRSYAANTDSSAVLGGLSQLMSISIAGGASTAHATTPSVTEPVVVATSPVDAPPAAAAHPDPAPSTPATPPAATVPTTTPPLQHAPQPAPVPAGGGFTPTVQPTVAVVAAVPTPTEQFSSQNTPAPAAFVPPAPTGPLNANDPAGTAVSGNASSASPTPEPASMLLLATGMLAVIGELRRRQVL